AWMKEPCASCPRRELDFGGCRCQAFALTGDATATDPVCHLAPDHARVVELAAVRSDAPYVYRRLWAGLGRRPPICDSDCAWGATCRTLRPSKRPSKRTIREDRMPIRFSPRRTLLLSATLASALAAFPAAAQQSTPTPPPPTPNQPTSD